MCGETPAAKRGLDLQLVRYRGDVPPNVLTVTLV